MAIGHAARSVRNTIPQYRCDCDSGMWVIRACEHIPKSSAHKPGGILIPAELTHPVKARIFVEYGSRPSNACVVTRSRRILWQNMNQRTGRESLALS